MVSRETFRWRDTRKRSSPFLDEKRAQFFGLFSNYVIQIIDVKTFFWIVVACAGLSWGYAYLMEKRILGSQDFQSFYQQKQDSDHQIDLLYEKISPINSGVSNLVAQINDIDHSISSLATEADKLVLERTSLRAEYDSTLSLPTLVSMGARSFFDGLTLGQFAEKGPMTESLKFQNWLTDVSKRDAVTIERANQIRQKWVNLEQARKSEATELLKLREQGMELIKPFTDELWPKNEELVYKLKPYRDELQTYDHQRTVGALVFWPALWFALTLKRSSKPA